MSRRPDIHPCAPISRRRHTLPLAVIALLILPATLFAELPNGWIKAGSQPGSYEMGIDTEVVFTGEASATIQSTEKEIQGFGTLMQHIIADDYRGFRIRLSGEMKSEEVTGWAGFWLRVDGPDPRRFLGFDNMRHRPVKGTTDWQRYEIVLDVPEEAIRIAYGFLLHGTGQIWADGLELETVGGDVPLTDITKSSIVEAPTNLDFDGR